MVESKVLNRLGIASNTRHETPPRGRKGDGHIQSYYIRLLVTPSLFIYCPELIIAIISLGHNAPGFELKVAVRFGNLSPTEGIH
jgi:hypothetical protein